MPSYEDMDNAEKELRGEADWQQKLHAPKPDPRDQRIRELEAALLEIEAILLNRRVQLPNPKLMIATIRAALSGARKEPIK